MNKEVSLIILRGNSGSGKTVTAKALQKKYGKGTMLISQDVVRREMLYVDDGAQQKAGELLYELALYGKSHCKAVILEGILNSEWYKELFEKLFDDFKDNIYAYYFDIPFEETLNRHRQKSVSHEFGEKEMRQWWNEKDLIRFIPEKLITKEMSLSDTVKMIYTDTLSDQISNMFIKYKVKNDTEIDDINISVFLFNINEKMYKDEG